MISVDLQGLYIATAFLLYSYIVYMCVYMIVYLSVLCLATILSMLVYTEYRINAIACLCGVVIVNKAAIIGTKI